ncbi:hypothetical protein ACVR0S_06220 [Streptococcus dentapri]|uniref:Signal peptide containing protein n=1 Tax=Streptococcus dentapri TaxID=573564 RepID=A0ABV8D076_9STRE
MKIKKSEALYFLLSIILLVLILGLYMYGKSAGRVKSGNAEVAPTYLSTSSSSSSEGSSDSLEADLKDLEENPSQEGIASVQTAINQVSDQETKNSYQERLNIVNAKLAVSEAENDKTAASVQNAQEAIDKVETQSKKEELQAQLDSVL